MSNTGAGAGVVMVGAGGGLDEDDDCGVLELVAFGFGSFFTAGFSSALEVDAMGDEGFELRRCPSRSVTSAIVLSRAGEPVDQLGVVVPLGT